MELGVYVHIPFCTKKCYYCDFTSFCNQSEYIEKYIDSLLKEIEYKKEEIDLTQFLPTIYS